MSEEKTQEKSSKEDAPAEKAPRKRKADSKGDAKRLPRKGPGALPWESLLGAPTAALLALVLFGMVNYLSARHYRRFDWTRHRNFTLSPRSREVLRGLSSPVDLYVLMGQREGQYSDVSELVDRYSAESQLVRVHRIDPDNQRDRFLELTRRLGIRVGRTNTADVASEAALVLTRGDRHWEIPRERMAGLAEDDTGASPAGERTATAQITVERALTEALLRVDRSDTSTVCFASGHGELPLQGGDDSLSGFAAELGHDNITTQGVELRGAFTVPARCEALVIAGAHTAFSEAEADALLTYLQRGGNLLLLADPTFLERRWVSTGLERVTRAVGIELTQALAVETERSHLVPEALPVHFLATEFGDHPATRSLRGQEQGVLVLTARALRRATDSSVVPESLLRTTGGAWGETSTLDAIQDGQLRHDSTDLSGPLDIALASRLPGAQAPAPAPGHARREAAGRVVVVGYSYLATNESFGPGMVGRFANSFFLQAAVGWLVERRELVEVPARPATAATLNVSVEDLRHIRLYAMGMVPLAAALVGLGVWRARKHR